MKTVIKTGICSTMIVLLAIGAIVYLSSCKKDETLSATDVVKAKLLASGASWKMQKVDVDGTDQSTVYKGLTITIGDGTFTTTGGGVVWPATGTWSFSSTDGTKVKRDDGTIVTVVVTDTTLKLTLTWSTTTLGGGRVESVQGVNVFTFGL